MEWVHLFHVLGSYTDSLDDSEVSEVKLKVGGDLQVGMAPKRRCIAFVVDSESLEESEPMTPIADLGADEDPILRLVSNWDHVVNQLESTTRDVSRFKARVMDQFDDLSVQIKILDSSIGENVMLDEVQQWFRFGKV